MDCSLNADEERRYRAWVHSPTVFSTDEEELILAFKISRVLHRSPSGTLKALRGVPGLNDELVCEVEDFVAQDSSLTYRQDGALRRIGLATRA